MRQQNKRQHNSSATAGRWWWWALAGLIVGAATALLALQLTTGGPFGPPRYHGTAFQQPRPVPSVTLTAHTGRPVSLQDLRGRVLLIYFGYTSCPDACPATMATLAAAVAELRPAQRDKVQVILISVDPRRDTPDVLAEYLSHFSPTFMGITGSREALEEVIAPFGVYFADGEHLDGGDHLVDHTARVFAVDKEAKLRLVYPFAAPSHEIAADLRHLIRE